MDAVFVLWTESLSTGKVLEAMRIDRYLQCNVTERSSYRLNLGGLGVT